MKKLSFINVRGIVTLVAVLALIDAGVAFGLAPLLTRFTQDQFNQFSETKIVIGSVRFHPALLSFGVSGAEVFDPQTQTRLFHAEHASLRLSPVSLLRRRLGFSKVTLRDVELEAVKDATGRYNFEMGPKPSKMELLKQLVRKDDLYGRLYENFKKLAEMNRKVKRKPAGPPDREVAELAKGRIVRFDVARDPVFEVGHFEMVNGTFVLKEKGGSIPPFRQVYILLKNFKCYRSKEVSFSDLEAKGKFEAEKKGSFHLDVRQKKEVATVDADVKNLDLAAFAPIYEDSLPVSFEKGFLSLDSKSRMAGDTLDSENRLKLAEHTMVAKKTLGVWEGPTGPIVDAINKRPIFEMKFHIGGTPDKPSFSGFQEVLMDLLKEDLQQLAAGGWKEKIKSFF
ncbi:MAG: DUF748 domain-containing protein [Candidatus Omnitrophota bacterium]